MLGMGQSVGIFGSVSMLGALAGVPGTAAMAIALATGLPGLQAINRATCWLGSAGDAEQRLEQ